MSFGAVHLAIHLWNNLQGILAKVNKIIRDKAAKTKGEPYQLQDSPFINKRPLTPSLSTEGERGRGTVRGVCVGQVYEIWSLPAENAFLFNSWTLRGR